MTLAPFTQICDMFYEVSYLPLTVCQPQGKPQYWAPRLESPDESQEANQALINTFAQASPDQNNPFVEISSPAFFFSVIKLNSGEYLIIGPASPHKHAPAEIHQLTILRGVPEEKRAAYTERLERIPVFSFRQFLTTICLVHYMFNGRLVSPEDILLSRSPIPAKVDDQLAQAIFNARENQVIHTPASFEHYILQAVSDGNLPKLKQALLSPVSGSIGKMSDDPIRQEKYTFICFVTLVTRAAIAGGLNQELTFSLSDIYCQRVDRLQNISDIARLSWEMCMDFTQKVEAVKWKNKPSPGVMQCCEYISLHLHENIDLTQLTNLARTSSKTLSKRFRSETGLTINDYIHRERIKEAQSLLKYTDYSISEIGYYLQYNSQSYFSSIFKKFSGLTPQQYREE